MFTIIGGVIVALSGWCAFHFIGSPLLRFRDLRNEVTARLAEYDNVLAQWKEVRGELQLLDLSPSEQKRLEEAQSTFRKLGSEMMALQNEWMAVKILDKRGYDPASVSSGLIGLSNSIGTYGMNRHHFKKMIQKALQLPEG